jgi:hypothetical protein
MKSTKTIAVHQTFEENTEGMKDAVLYVAAGDEVQRLLIGSKKFEKFLSTLNAETVVRSTSANPTDATLGILSSTGATVASAPWHSTGIAKNLPPEEIADHYFHLSDNLFRPVVYRKDIAELKVAVGIRNALIRFQGDFTRRIKQQGRNVGVTDIEKSDDPLFAEGIATYKELRKGMLSEDGTSYDTYVAKLAKRIPECLAFNRISGMDSMILAASFVAVIGDCGRFSRVASLWHYFGQHVEDGRMPKRRKGAASDWNARGRTLMYQLGSCIIKNRNNPWHQMFDEIRAYEIAHHDEKHPGCKSRDGHCTSMAAHKVAKEILKRFWVEQTGNEFVAEHNPAGGGHKKIEHQLWNAAD